MSKSAASRRKRRRSAFARPARVELLIGTQSTGQGHETAYAQIVADRARHADRRGHACVQGDTDRIPSGKGTGGSRSLPVGGPAIDGGMRAAWSSGAGAFAAPPAAGRRGRHRLRRRRVLQSAAASARSPILDAGRGGRAAATNLPPGEATPGLDAMARSHLASLDLSQRLPRLRGRDRSGDRRGRDRRLHAWSTTSAPSSIRCCSPARSTAASRRASARRCSKHAVYDRDSGQLLTGIFVDYALPRAADLPAIEPAFNVVPCTTNPLGIKGAGEAGAIAACPAVINAVIDALSPRGVTHIDMPATPATIWRALHPRPVGPLSPSEESLPCPSTSPPTWSTRLFASPGAPAKPSSRSTKLDFAVDRKGDASPVTEADRRAEAVILAGLEQEIGSTLPDHRRGGGGGRTHARRSAPRRSGWSIRSTAPRSSSAAAASSPSTSR